MRINIIGAAPGWENVPVDDGEIWGVNNTHLLRDVDRIIDVHDRLNPTEKKDKFHMKELRAKHIPAYFQEEIEGYPNIKRYPIEDIIKEFDSDYFGSGIDYIIALAVFEGATEVHIYGVMMAQKGEYAHQKPSVEHWIGIAKGRGVKVRVHGRDTAILRTKNYLMYGYQKHQSFVSKYFPESLTAKDLIGMYE